MKLVSIELETTLGAKYAFPDVELDIAQQLLRQWPPAEGKVVLVNASGAFLSLPFRIVAILNVDGVLHWRRPNADLHEL